MSIYFLYFLSSYFNSSSNLENIIHFLFYIGIFKNIISYLKFNKTIIKNDRINL